MRSLAGSYKWVTSPLVLERYHRDRARCGLPGKPFAVRVERSGGVPGALASGEGALYLEERELAITGACPQEVIAAVAPLIRHRETSGRLASQVVIVDDDDFTWFCRYAVPVQARNVLEEGTKRTQNLWYEESLPTDTVLYMVAMARDEAAHAAVVEMFPDQDPYLQLGGNETVGHGWGAVSILPDGARSELERGAL